MKILYVIERGGPADRHAVIETGEEHQGAPVYKEIKMSHGNCRFYGNCKKKGGMATIIPHSGCTYWLPQLREIDEQRKTA